MTITEMITQTQLLLDKEDSPDMTSVQIVPFLNRATEEIVDDYYRKFETDQYALDAIRTLVESEIVLTLSSGHYQFPADYRHLLRLNATTTDPTCNKTYTKTRTRFVQQDDWNEAMEDPFEKGKAKLPIYYVDKDGIVMDAGSGNTITEVQLTYLRNPATLADPGTSSDLPVLIHEDIVNRAVRSLLELVEQPRQQSFIREQQIQD